MIGRFVISICFTSLKFVQFALRTLGFAGSRLTGFAGLGLGLAIHFVCEFYFHSILIDGGGQILELFRDVLIL